MIILTSYGIIVFHLVEWICEITKSSEAVREVDCRDRLAFAVPAIPTRHEITCRSAD